MATTTKMRLFTARLPLLVQRRGFASSQPLQRNYAFIGLGQMGFRMAFNLKTKLDKSDQLAVFDVNPKAMQEFEECMKGKGARKGAAVRYALSSSNASKKADVVITALPRPEHVEAVFNDIFQNDYSPRSERLFIDTSTIDPATSRRIAQRARDTGHGTLVDAPMSGGVVGARAGTLTFMLGAAAEDVARAEAVLLRMGRQVLPCGPQGAGLCAKLANNYLLALSNIATAEAMNLGLRWGLDAKTLAGVINLSTGRCWPSEVNNPVPGVADSAAAARDYRGGFGIALMRKDLDLAVAAARQAGAAMALADAAQDTYRRAEAVGEYRDRDFSVVYKYLSALSPPPASDEAS